MKRFLKVVLIFALAAESVLAAPPPADQTLKLSQGTISVGGRFAVPYVYRRSGLSQISFREDPEFSYFVYDNLRLVFSLQTEVYLRWSPIYPVTPGAFRWGALIGAEYFFPVGHNLYPFTGLHGGVRVQNLAWDQTLGVLQVPVGLLWAMNEHVALVFAVPVAVTLSKQFGFEGVEVTPGYFGVLGFF